jgi:hypothetical protein
LSSFLVIVSLSFLLCDFSLSSILTGSFSDNN